jgi:hypothetical protein
VPASTVGQEWSAMLFKHIMAQVLLSTSESLSMTWTKLWGKPDGSFDTFAFPCFPKTNRTTDRMATKLQQEVIEVLYELQTAA